MLFLHLIPFNEEHEPFYLKYSLVRSTSLDNVEEKDKTKIKTNGEFTVAPRVGIFPAPEYIPGCPWDMTDKLKTSYSLSQARKILGVLLKDPAADVLIFSNTRSLITFNRLLERLLLNVPSVKLISFKCILRAASLFKKVFPYNGESNLCKLCQNFGISVTDQLTAVKELFNLIQKKEPKLLNFFLYQKQNVEDFQPFSAKKLLAAVGEKNFNLILPLVNSSNGYIGWDLAYTPSNTISNLGWVKFSTSGDLLISPASVVTSELLEHLNLDKNVINTNFASLLKLILDSEFKKTAMDIAFNQTEYSQILKNLNSSDINHDVMYSKEYMDICNGDTSPAGLVGVLPSVSNSVRTTILDYLFSEAPDLLPELYLSVYSDVCQDRIYDKRDTFIGRINSLGEKLEKDTVAISRLKRMLDFLKKNG